MDAVLAQYLAVIRKYAVFDGRARRREYWMFFLVNLVIGIVGGIIRGIIGLNVLGTLVGGILALYSLALLVPSLAVAVRRLHDTGRSGWWLLLSLIPFGAFVVLYFLAQDGQPGTNAYGPNPKGVFA